MSREAEVNEPLLVDPSSHFLEDGDAARVVFDQVVVDGENGRDATLRRQVRRADLKGLYNIAIEIPLRTADRKVQKGLVRNSAMSRAGIVDCISWRLGSSRNKP